MAGGFYDLAAITYIGGSSGAVPSPPTAPTALLCKGRTNPTSVFDLSPEFSAIYEDPNAGDIATHAYVQIGTTVGASDKWNSGWFAITNVAEGSRCEDITREGEALGWGVTYYWRIRFRDDEAQDGAWSANAHFTMETREGVGHRTFIGGLAGTEITDNVDRRTLTIENVLTRQIDTCSFRAVDATLANWNEIEVWRSALDVKEFAGYITELDATGPHEHEYTGVKAEDYTVLLSTAVVNDTYEDMTDAAIIQSMFAEYLPEVTTALYVETGATIDKIVFERVTLLDALQQICELSGYDFYVDYDKRLRYFASGQYAAPFDLSTSPDYSTMYPLRVETHRSVGNEIINKVLVEGGWYPSPDTYFYLEGNAEIVELNLTRRLHAPSGETAVKVWQNDGTKDVPVWTALSLGTLYLHEFTDGYDVLYGYSEKVLQFNTAPPALENAIRTQGQYEIPILVRRRSQASYDTYGRWFESVLTDSKLETVLAAKDAAQAILAKHAFAKVRGKAVTFWQGLRSGQTISIYHSKLGLDASYLIHRVKSANLSAARWQYTIEYGEYNPDLIDLLLKLKRTTEARTVREDEILNELLEMGESITLTETSTSVTESGPVYRWGAYSGADTEIRWSFFKWA